jgi:hypothetical protein
MARAQAVAAGCRIFRRLSIAVVVAAALVAAGVALWLVVRPSARAPHLLVGVDDDTVKWTSTPLAVVHWQRSLGAQAVRVWVPWHGEARLSRIRRVELSRAEQAARATHVVLAISGFANEAPLDTPAENRFCGYARAVVSLVPDADAVVVWNEANSPTYWRGTAREYESLLARCYDILHRAGLTVLDSTASAHSPRAFLRALGDAYRSSGRQRPLVDAFGHNPYPATATEAPGARHRSDFLGEGDYGTLLATLRSAFARTPQHALDVWYLEDGFQSEVPPRLRWEYTGRETVPATTPELQAERLADAIRLAACQPRVHAFFNFELVDESRLSGWQSGLIWRGVRRKPAAGAFAAAAREAASGCRGAP